MNILKTNIHIEERQREIINSLQGIGLHIQAGDDAAGKSRISSLGKLLFLMLSN